MYFRGSLAHCYSPRGELGLAPLRCILFNKSSDFSVHETRMYRLYLPWSTRKLDKIIHLCFVRAVWHVVIRPEMNLGWPHWGVYFLTNQRTCICIKRGCTGLICYVILKNSQKSFIYAISGQFGTLLFAPRWIWVGPTADDTYWQTKERVYAENADVQAFSNL